MKKQTNGEWYEVLDELYKRKVIPDHVHRVFLWGACPGTGKSSWASYQFGPERVERISIHEKMFPDDLLGTMALESADNGGTDTVVKDGYATRAMRFGRVLVLDEIQRRSPALESALHAILDDRNIAGISLPNGERVTPNEGFLVVATSNQPPSSLGEALRDRFDVYLQVTVPHPDALKSIRAHPVRKALINHYDRQKKAKYQPEFSLRRGLAYDRMLRAGVDEELAARCVFCDAWQDQLSVFTSAEAETRKAA